MTANEEILNKAVEDFLKAKVEYDRLEKVVKGLNAEVKKLMKELDITKWQCGDKIVNYKLEYRKSLDEDKLIRELHRYAPETNAIKTKEYVDMDILEGEVYKEQLSAEALKAMSGCYESKEIVKLTVSKNKED